MTENQFKAKFDEMLEKAIETVKAKGYSLFLSGAIDSSQYEDDFILPRIILVVALEHGIDQVKPLSREYKKEIANLRHF